MPVSREVEFISISALNCETILCSSQQPKAGSSRIQIYLLNRTNINKKQATAAANFIAKILKTACRRRRRRSPRLILPWRVVRNENSKLVSVHTWTTWTWRLFESIYCVQHSYFYQLSCKIEN